MALSIKDPEADRLARAIAARTGESLTQAVVNALRDRLAKEERKNEDIESRVADAMEIGRHYVSQPLLDQRTPEEIIGYDEHGLPR
jgi:antitoxin VapB